VTQGDALICFDAIDGGNCESKRDQEKIAQLEETDSQPMVVIHGRSPRFSKIGEGANELRVTNTGQIV
jgi:hypothetical protein